MKLLELPDLGIPASRAAWNALPADDAARLRTAWTADALVVVEGFSSPTILVVTVESRRRCVFPTPAARPPLSLSPSSPPHEGSGVTWWQLQGPAF